MTILVVEDEESIVKLLRDNLAAGDFEVTAFSNGDDAWSWLREHTPELALLNWKLTGSITGIDICSWLRSKEKTRQVPILMLIASADELDLIKGLDAGADGYVVKPFSIGEMIERVCSMLGRPEKRPAHLRIGDIVLDRVRRYVVRAGHLVQLTQKEFDVLHLLMNSPGRVFSRNEILFSVWGANYHPQVDNIVDVQISFLRKKLKDGKDPILTVRGEGYSFDKNYGLP